MIVEISQETMLVFFKKEVLVLGVDSFIKEMLMDDSRVFLD
jgi:hypothetical protein